MEELDTHLGRPETSMFQIEYPAAVTYFDQYNKDPLPLSISQIDYHNIQTITSTGQDIKESERSITQTEDQTQSGTSLDQDILPLQASISQINYHFATCTSTGQDMKQSETSTSETEDHAQAGTTFEQQILPLQASISQIDYHIPTCALIGQDMKQLETSILQREDHAQAGTSLEQEILPLQASISQIDIPDIQIDIPTCTSAGQDMQQSETLISQTEDHSQPETSVEQDILPIQTLISQIDYVIHTDVSHSQGTRSLQASISQSEKHTPAGISSYGLQTSLAQKDYVEASTSKKSPEIPPIQPYKKRKLDAKQLQEIEMCMQEIRQEEATREIETTISIEIEPEENTTIEQQKEKRKRVNVYKHIDFLSDSDEFVYSSSSWQDSDETDCSENNDTTDKKKKNTKVRKQKKSKNTKDIVLDDTKENTKPEKIERKINKNKVRSSNMNSGKQYTTKTGKVIAEKKVKSSTCTPENCHNNCYDISSEKRQAIFDHYWSLSRERQKDWLVSNSKKQETKRKRCQDINSRRHWTFDYYINEGEGKRKVCLKFMLSTLDIKQKFLHNVISTAIQGSAKKDGRGKHIPGNKTPEINIEAVKCYIRDLPYLPSHYCRKNSKRFYLPQEFRNLSNLYKMYKEKMLSEDRAAVGEKVFQNIFGEFNIGFHIPRKDKCSKCVRFEKEDGGEEKLAHLKDKEETYERFQVHQKIQDENILCVSFDLQKVLNTPYGQSMLLYYSRKLAVYNLTFYESKTREGYCYSWNETEGKRGANEVCTILDRYIKMVDDRGSVKHLLLYSDACPGQNKNKVVLAAIHSCLQKCDNISSIQMNYLLPGHTYMPVDSMHSVIEKSVTNTIVWAPSQWATVFMLARKNPKPYHVQILTHKDFCGWDVVGDRYFKGNLTGKISKVILIIIKYVSVFISLCELYLCPSGNVVYIIINK